MASNEHFQEWDLKPCRAARAKKQPAPHQKAALVQLRKWYETSTAGGEGGILVLPTGAGKTFTAIHFLCNGPLSDGYKVLWLAHTHHLLEQAFHSFRDSLGHVREPRDVLRLRVVSGTPGHYPPRDIASTDDVVIATLQTITTAHREELKSLRGFLTSAAGRLLVVFDEAHHAPAPSYRKLLMALREEGARTLGLTATPTYSDEAKKGWLKRLFPQGILAQARTADLIAAGVLARPIFERPPTSIVPQFEDADYEKWLGTYRDLPENVIDQLARNSERNAFIADTYAQNRDKYGKAIIFTDRWFQCESIVEALQKRGVRADALYSHVDAKIASVEGRRKRDRDENIKALARFRNNECEVLVNVRMLTEGTDLPDARTVFLTRQTTSQILLTQMVGRALRGPKFGGTSEAFVVSFVDEWHQAISWAEYDQLAEGQADESVREPSKRPPLQLISIELVKQLARQMDSGVNVATAAFSAFMPVGWYRVTYDVLVEGTDEVDSGNRLVMVFDDERSGFEALIQELLSTRLVAFADEAVLFEGQRPVLDMLREKHLPDVRRTLNDLTREIFHLARHMGQDHGVPEFFPFSAAAEHDLDSIARGFIAQDLGPRAIHEQLRAEYARKDRFWRVFFPQLDQFRSWYDSCQARLLAGHPSSPAPQPRGGAAPPSFSEPDEEVKEQIKRRDGSRCLACGTTRNLHVDHIISAYHGGSGHPDNLQTLCKTCNTQKRTRTIRFTTQHTVLSVPPKALEHFNDPDDPTDAAHWERFLRRTINFSYQCAAVSAVEIGKRGDAYYNWSIELMGGNDPALIAPHLEQLFERVNDVRRGAVKPELQSLTVAAPGEEAVRVPVQPRRQVGP